MAEKVVQTMGNYEMISWVVSDVVHYGIRERGKTNFVSTYKPTPGLKGWPLRKAVETDLQTIASQQTVPEEFTYPEEYIPVGMRDKVNRTTRLPIVCWNPPKRIARRCDICHYSWMCRMPLKLYPAKDTNS